MNDLNNATEPKDVTIEIAGGSFEPNSVDPVYGSRTINVNIGLSERRGKCMIAGSNSGPIGRWDFVALYEGDVPSDPNSGYLDYFYVANDNAKITSSTWGTGYSCAYASWDYRLGKYVTVAKTSQTR